MLSRRRKRSELGLRQWVRSEMFDWVLGGDHHERVIERVRSRVNGDLPLVHGFHERALRTWCRSVDLVCQDKVCEDRPLAKFESVVGLAIYGYANDI